MLYGKVGQGKAGSNSLMSEYASLLADAVLRNRTRRAEHAARIEAELASRVKSEFISNMSHELRTPLNTVIGFSKILMEHQRRKLPDAEIVEYANLVHDAASHLLSVINDILDISKIQSGRYTLDSREVVIDEVLQAALSSQRQVAADSGVELVKDFAPSLAPVRGDPAKLRQVFTNLLSNAIKFSRQGGTVRTRTQRLQDGGALIAISDSGIGMTEQELAIALTPFGQVDGSRARWREGTGLGLPIARALVDLHGGQLEIESEKDRGTTVTVILPPRHQVSIHEGRDAVLGSGVRY
jgi:two-component system cell cycle sensor histidine kinase PleC